MKISSGISRFLLFLGDVVLFYVALVVSLGIRYGFDVDSSIIRGHAVPFSILFVVWIIVFIIGGLYEKHARVLKNRLPGTILRVQIANSIIAVIFFYAIPYFGIAPKTTLFVYLIVSFILIVLWRMYGPLLFGYKAQGAIVMGGGEEFHELVSELSRTKGYPITPYTVIDLDAPATTNLRHQFDESVRSHPHATVIVADLSDRRIEALSSSIYQLVSNGYVYIEFNRLYEDIFNRLPVSLLDERWLIQNMSLLPRRVYDILKRTIDIVIGGIGYIISLPFYVIAFILIKLDDGGPLFFVQERIGQGGSSIRVMKFRSMSAHNEKDGLAKEKRITRVGVFLRKSRIDELPQLWNVVRGDLSLIGPRPEVPALVKIYDEQVPYYSLRHIVKPGLSGWAQIRQRTPPRFVAEVDATKQKVSYDLFYIKHRSFALDMLIALQTIRELLSRRGL